jgi:microcystin-dependent protein
VSLANPPPPVRSPMTDENGYCTDIWRAFFNSFYNSVSPVSIGTIWLYASNIPPFGWLLCDGSAYSRKDYVDLFTIIGTAFGSGDGSTTFNTPNLIDHFVKGSVSAIGTTGGAASFLITQDTLPVLSLEVVDPGHSHTFNPDPHTHTISDPKHSHTFNGDPHHHTVLGGAVGAGGFITTGTAGSVDTSDVTATGSITAEFTGVTNQDASASGTNSTEVTNIEVNLLGGGQSISLLPTYLNLAYIIKF